MFAGRSDLNKRKGSLWDGNLVVVAYKKWMTVTPVILLLIPRKRQDNFGPM